jgi:hypothetical protein
MAGGSAAYKETWMVWPSLDVAVAKDVHVILNL